MTRAVLGAADGCKRCAPGYGTHRKLELPVLAHDCLTLDDKSSSCVLSLGLSAAVGVHIGGLGADQPTGICGAANRVLSLAELGGYPVAALLRDLDRGERT